MSKPEDVTDDLEAVRKITETLKPFDVITQERIIRWTKEKLGRSTTEQSPAQRAPADAPPHQHAFSKRHTQDIKSFVTDKNPVSDTHFAASVAYFYKFEAHESERKDSIAAKDLQEACRKVGRNRFKNPLGTLNNAHRDGFLDRAGEKGKFTINTVGENLVAMTLPGGTIKKPTSRKPQRAKAKTSKKAGKQKANK